MSSHREAPEISKDPVADSTDVYAFVSPSKPDHVVLIANYVPLQAPDGGPNFYEFGDDVTYEIHVSNSGKSTADISYQFRFTTEIRNPKTFLYNIGPITSIGDKNWNRPQFYSVTRVENGKRRQLAGKLACPPVNVGPRSTPDYAKLSSQAVHKLGRGRVFAGQRADAFHVDLGSIFDLGALRPLNEAHLIPLAKMDGINSVQAFNVHSIAHRGADHRADPQRPQAEERQLQERHDRRLDHGQAPEERGCTTTSRTATAAPARGSRSRGWATRWSTRS